MATVGELVLQLKAQGINVTERQLRRLDNQTKKTGMSMKAMIASVGGIYALGSAFSSVVGIGREFTASQANLAAIIGTTSDKLGVLDTTAKELGATTKFTASQVVQLQTEFAKLGFTTQQITDAQEATLALASATNVDLATAAEVAGQQVNAFGLGAAQTDRVVNVMAASFSSSALDMEKFTNSMVYVSAVANQSGISIEATTGVLGKLADVGIDGSIAGTALRRIFLEMGNEASKLSKKVGFAVKSEEDLFKALKMLNKEGLSTAEMEDLVGKRAISAFSNMLKFADSSEELSEKITGTNRAMEMADEQLDNLDGDMLKLTSATAGLSIEIFEALEPALRAVVQSMTDFVSSINVEKLRSLAETALATAGIFATYTVATKLLALSKLGLAGALKAASAAYVKFAMSSGGTMLALTAVATIIHTLKGGFRELSQEVNYADGEIAGVFSRTGQHAKHLSLESRRANIDLMEIQERVNNATLTATVLNEKELRRKLETEKKELASLKEKTEKIDIVNEVIMTAASLYNNYNDVLATSADKNANFGVAVKSNAEVLDQFSLTNKNAAVILKNIADTGLENLITGFERTVDASEGYGNFWTAKATWKDVDVGIKSNVKNLQSLSNETLKVTAVTDTNNKVFSESETVLNSRIERLRKGQRVESAYTQLTGDTVEIAVAKNANEIEKSLLRQAKAIRKSVPTEQFEKFKEILGDIIVINESGALEISADFKLLQEQDVKIFQSRIEELEQTINNLTDIQNQEATDVLNSNKTILESIINTNKEKADQAKQSASVVNLSLAMEKLGIENLTASHIQYANELMNLEDANGKRLYTDDQVVQMLIASEDGLNRVSFAQIAYTEAVKQATIVDAQEENAIINKLIALDLSNDKFDMASQGIDSYVAAVKKSIEEGKSFEEAIETATGIDPEQLKKDADARQETLDLIQQFEDAALQIKRDAQQQTALDRAEFDLKELDDEFKKIQQSAYYKELQAQDDEESKAKLLAIQQNYNNQKAKLLSAEEIAEITKYNNVIGYIGDYASAIAGVWQITGKNAEAMTALQYVQAIADTYKAATSALANNGGFPAGIPAMGITIIQGLAQVAQIQKARDQAKQEASKSVTAQYGANFITQGETSLTVGDNPGGRELVNVTPLSSPNMFGDAIGESQAQNISINIEGGVVSSEFVENELAEKISDAVRRGVDFGMS